MRARILGTLMLVLLVLLVLLGLAPATLAAQERFSRSTWIENGHKIEVEAHGDVDFTDDGRGIERLSEGGRFQLLEERPGMPARRAELRPGAGGGIERSYWVDGVPSVFDAVAAEWFEDLLPRVIRRSSCRCSSTSQSSSSSASEAVEPPNREGLP